jgi:RNA polymerase sigma factor (sigma-70 family)
MIERGNEMMYRPSEDTELTGAQMERARSVFIGWLWQGNLSADFIHNHADDLLGEAHGELVKAVNRGEEIEDPVGWTVFCAWRRLNRRLERGPEVHEFASEKLPELADPDAKTPEGEVEDRDRLRKIQEAVRQLRRDQQQIIALTYFEGETLRDAAETLGWGYGTAHRRYKAAVEKLEKHFRAMGIESSDDLWVEIGVVATLAATGSRPSFHVHAIEMAADKAEHLAGGAWEKASHLATGAWARGQDLARRLSLGGNGDAAGALASNGASHTGVCATEMLACVFVASAIVAPAAGVAQRHDHQQGNVSAAQHPISRSALTAQANEPSRSNAAANSSASRRSNSTTTTSNAASHVPVYGPGSPSDLHVAESGLENRIEGEESSAPPEASSSSAPASASSAPTSATVSAPSASGSSSTSRARAAQQFDTIR